MLNEQIKALIEQEETFELEIMEIEEQIKDKKKKLALVKKSRQQLEKLEEQLSGQVDVSA